MSRRTLMSNGLMSLVLALMMAGTTLSDVPEDKDVVKRNKGVGDITVNVGFLFHHRIPDDAFSGDVVEYKVGEEACGKPLPSWLDFDQSTNTFTGFTKSSQIENKTPVCVKAIGRTPAPGVPPSSAEDVFSIEVIVGPIPAFACPETDSVVLATVYVDLTLPELSKEQILKVLVSLAEALDIAPEDIRLTRLRNRYPPERFPVLFSGKGDNKEQQHVGGRIQWQVGCSSDSITENNPFVRFLQEKAPTGQLASIIGYSVMDWTVHKGFPRGNAPRQ